MQDKNNQKVGNYRPSTLVNLSPIVIEVLVELVQHAVSWARIKWVI